MNGRGQGLFLGLKIIFAIMMKLGHSMNQFFRRLTKICNKTLELFGRKNEDGTYVAFHVYSMRQAIEEGFILDVLEHYTTFQRYFKLVKTMEGDEEYEHRVEKELEEFSEKGFR